MRAKNAYSGESIALYSLMTQDECDDILNSIEEAYTILSIPEKRREYDRVRGIHGTPAQVHSDADIVAQTMGMTSTSIFPVVTGMAGTKVGLGILVRVGASDRYCT